MSSNNSYFSLRGQQTRHDDKDSGTYGRVPRGPDQKVKPPPSQGTVKQSDDYVDLPIPQPELRRHPYKPQPPKMKSGRKGKKGKRGTATGVVRLHLKHLSQRPLSDNFLNCWVAKHKGVEPNTESIDMAASFISADTIYEFRLSRYFSKTTTVGGVLDDYFSNDPSSYSEWSALITLFSMCRIRRATARFATCYSRTVPTVSSTGGFRPMVVNANYDDVGAPGSYAGALDSPMNKVWNYAFDTSQLALTMGLTFSGEHEPLWADVTTPSSSTLYQGCPGCFQMYADSSTASTEVIGVVQDLFIQFMNRY